MKSKNKDFSVLLGGNSWNIKTPRLKAEPNQDVEYKNLFVLPPISFLLGGLVKIKTLDFTSEILDRVRRIERTLTQSLEQAENKPSLTQLFNNKPKVHRNKQESSNVINQWLERTRVDKELRWPHTKIIMFLLDQFDFTKNEFKEAQFTKIVKGSRVGKNMANNYLSLLEQKGYIEKRCDGYRVFFKIRG